MKKIFLGLAMLGLFLPAAEKAEAADISINLFYDNLGGGAWYDVGDYGYVWQPSVAVGNSTWRPYADGYWAFTDLGWTWVSYEDFGWATYHYGRWARLANFGWVWVPGYEWGPAWVSWRTGGSYVGWAPLPPHGEAIYEGRPIYGRVDVDYDIGPLYYNFVDVRYLGAPVLRQHIFEPTRNITIINNTVNVTNITYRDNRVFNYGPDFDTVNRFSNRKIQRLKLQRQTDLDASQALQMGTMTKVQGDTLMVAAPQKVRKAERQAATPKNIKQKIENPNIERGWSGISDEKVRRQLKKKMEAEDSKNPPPLTAGGTTPDAAEAKPQGDAEVAGQTAEEGGKGRKNRNKDPQQAGEAQPIDGQDAEAQANAGQGVGQANGGRKGGNKKNRQEAVAAEAGVGADGRAIDDATNVEAQGDMRGGRKAARRLEKLQEQQQQQQQDALQQANEKAPQMQDADQQGEQRGQKRKRQEALEMTVPPEGPDAGANGLGGGEKAERRAERQQQQEMQQQQRVQQEQMRQQQQLQQQQMGQSQGEGRRNRQEQGGGGGKKGKKQQQPEGEPSPSPEG